MSMVRRTVRASYVLVAAVYLVGCGGPGSTDGQQTAREETRASEADAPVSSRAAGDGAAPERASQPDHVHLTLESGTRLRLVLDDTLSTRRNEPGDAFTARAAADIEEDGHVAVPRGSVVRGEVTGIRKRSTEDGEQTILHLAFREIEIRGRGYPLSATLTEAHPETRSSSSTAEDAAKVGAGAAAGAILGRIIGGDTKGAVIGAAAGAAAGTGVVLATKDTEAYLPAGSEVEIRLEEALEVRHAM